MITTDKQQRASNRAGAAQEIKQGIREYLDEYIAVKYHDVVFEEILDCAIGNRVPNAHVEGVLDEIMRKINNQMRR